MTVARGGSDGDGDRASDPTIDSWGDRLGRTFNRGVVRLVERVTPLLPAPVGVSALSSLRTVIADELLSVHREEVARAQALFRSDGEGMASPGAQAVAAVAGRLLGEMRAEVVRRAAGRGARFRLLARLDQRLPTERVEHIDDPHFPAARRVAAIRSLDRLNRRLGSYARFLDALEPLLSTGRSTTVLDLASGHGGFPISLAALARARGHQLRVIASDLRPEYVDLGRRHAERIGERGVEFRVVDAFRIGDTLGDQPIDLITCTQTLHHFGGGLVAALVAATLRHARRGLLFIDAARSASRLLFIGAATLLSSPDRAFFDDGTTSVRKSFVPEELHLLSRCAPGGEALLASYLSPGFSVLRSR